VIKLDFTSPILPSGSAITRYVDKEDGSEYIYSLFVPSDASTAFPVFDQPDLKARFTLTVLGPRDWKVIANSSEYYSQQTILSAKPPDDLNLGQRSFFGETKPISTYVFAFAAGPWERVAEPPALAGGTNAAEKSTSDANIQRPSNTASMPPAYAGGSAFYVRRSQLSKFKPHAAEVFRLNHEAVKYFEQYFDYKFPFPKYDLVLIPEFPFGGMEHAGATFLRESAIIFPQEPTKNDLVSRATLIFHEAAHQWFGDTVTMRWFDDLWLKEGFATFTAYKAMEKIMPEMNAWKVFYERIKQGAYQTDSTRGTTAIYQPIANLSAAKSAYGNIVYNKAPAFLRQAEFYLGEDKFQTAVRAFLKKHEFGNAGWEDLVKEFQVSSSKDLDIWAAIWVKTRGLTISRLKESKVDLGKSANLKGKVPKYSQAFDSKQVGILDRNFSWPMNAKFLTELKNGERITQDYSVGGIFAIYKDKSVEQNFIFPNYGDYGYGIFLLDEKSRDYVLKNIRREKDPFLRSMMWGALWDSVREGELDPRVFVELVVNNLSTTPSAAAAATPPQTGGESEMQKPAREQGRNEQRSDHALANAQASALEEDESTVATLLGRTGTALNYYLSVPPAVAGGALSAGSAKSPPATAGGTDKTADLRTRLEDMLIERMRSGPRLGQRITFYRAFLNVAASEKARGVLKEMLNSKAEPLASASGKDVVETGLDRTEGAKAAAVPPAYAGGSAFPLRTKDKFDIITRLLILNDPDAPRLLADLEKTETSDDAKRYAYAAKAGIGTAENKAKYWKDFTENKEISESWIEAAFGPWNSIRHSDLTLPYLQKALQELPNHKRNRKIFFVNGWLGAFIGGQRSEEALAIVNKFLADNPTLDNDLRLKILENVDLIERAVRIRGKFKN
ncbi:MAG: hypothetical protein HOP17_15735, partial [Acidobacteria bacterium]|nr:hypothetical protein [Acidobacteriota bacterium]